MTTSSHSERHRTRYSSLDLDEALGLATALLCLGLVLAGAQHSVLPPPKPAAARESPRVPGPAAVALDAGATAKAVPAAATLQHFKAALEAPLDKPLRVMWLGDSHTAGVFWPAAFEAALLARKASGGPGYLPLGLGYGRYHGARIVTDEGFDLAPHPPARRSPEDDGVFGLGGTRASPRDQSLGITIKFDSNLASGDVNCELLFRYRQPNDRLALVAGGKKLDGPTGDEIDLARGLRLFAFRTNAHVPLEIRAIGGSPELFGLVVENERPGLVLDVLGINGARFATPLAWDQSSWEALVRWRHPTLAIIAYGTNEVFDLVSPDRYAEEIKRLVDRIRSAVDGVDCLLAGPTDVGRGGRIAEERAQRIDQIEAQTARRLGCAYFSPYQTMGGAQGFEHWLHASPALAVSDRIHLTAAGYRRLGEAMARDMFPAVDSLSTSSSP